MVLVGTDEHDRPLPLGNTLCEAVTIVEFAGQPQCEDVDQAVDGRRGTGAAENDLVLFAATHRAPDRCPSAFTQGIRLRTGE